MNGSCNKRSLSDIEREQEHAPPETVEEWIADAKALAFDRLVPQLIKPSDDDQLRSIFHRVQIPPTVKTARPVKTFKLDADREDRLLQAMARLKRKETPVPSNVNLSDTGPARHKRLAQQYKQERDAFRQTLFARQHQPLTSLPLPLDQLVSAIEQKTAELRASGALASITNIGKGGLAGPFASHRPLWEILEEERQLIDDPNNPRPVSYAEPNDFGVRLVKPIKLFEHQVNMVRWLIQRETVQHPSYVAGQGGGIMAMEMGLGKTLCLITLILTTLNEQRRLRSPSIYVCPKSLLYQVRQEFIKFAGSQVKVLIYHRDAIGSYIDSLSFRDILEADVIITTYESLRNIVTHGLNCLAGEEKEKETVDPGPEAEEFNNMCKASFHVEWLRHTWFRLILDESHCIREHKTRLFKTICQLKSPRRICSTGTPLHNSIRDVFNQLIFTGLAIPKKWAKKLNKDTLTLLQAWNCLYFVEESVLTDVKLPEKRCQVIYFDLGPEEKEVYTYYRRRTIDSLEKLNQFGISKERQTFAAVVNFTRLLQVCNAAFLSLPLSHRQRYDPQERGANLSRSDGLALVPTEKGAGVLDVPEDKTADVEQLNVFPWMIQRTGTAGMQSSKIRQVIQTVNTIHAKEPGAKILIFTNLHQNLRLVMDAFGREPRFQQLLEKGHHPFGSIYGAKSMNDRQNDIVRFQDDPHMTLLFLTLKTGGTGLNLTVAHHVIFVDPWHTYAPLYQAEKRSHRIGQTQPVYVYYMIARNTVEEGVYARAMERKSEAEDISKPREDRIVNYAEYIGKMLTIGDVYRGQQAQASTFSWPSSHTGLPNHVPPVLPSSVDVKDILDLDNMSSSSESDVEMASPT